MTFYVATHIHKIKHLSQSCCSVCFEAEHVVHRRY